MQYGRPSVLGLGARRRAFARIPTQTRPAGRNYDVQCADDVADRIIARIQPWQGTIEHGILANQALHRTALPLVGWGR